MVWEGNLVDLKLAHWKPETLNSNITVSHSASKTRQLYKILVEKNDHT